MSHSKRKTPVRGVTTCESEKSDKAAAHRRIRRSVAVALHVDATAEVLPHEKELSNPWLMGKDGKHRFDPIEWRKLMRK